LEVQGAVNMCKKYGMEAVKVVTGMVMAHNKRVMQTRVVPAVATNTLGDFLLA
jgi:hypothetical protein